MPTSASRPKAPRRLSAGFTLLEILVVLVIIGLMAAAAAPRMSAMYDSVAFALSRESFEQHLNGLSYEAFSTHRDLILIPTTEKGRDALKVAGPGAVDVMAREVQLPAPADWQIYIDEPIIYRASGYCRGGALSVKVGAIIENYVLRPPFCRAEAVP